MDRKLELRNSIKFLESQKDSIASKDDVTKHDIQRIKVINDEIREREKELKRTT